MTTRTFTPSRRSALQLFGASAAAMTPGFAYAMQARSNPLLTLHGAALAWPQYHRLASFGIMPDAGDRVYLERDVAHPNGDRGIAVTLSSGEALGFVTNQNTAALDWALQRSANVEARIVDVDLAVVKGRRVPGWGAFRIDVTVHEDAGLV